MTAASAHDNEMNNKLMDYFLSDPDLTFHKSNQKHAATQGAGTQDAGQKQGSN